jgi:putative transposase
LEKAFRRHKLPEGKSWRMDETDVRIKDQWKYLYRAVDKAGKTIEFLFRTKGEKVAARRFFDKAIGQNGSPGTVTIDKSGSNLAALHAVNAERETPIQDPSAHVPEQPGRAGPSGHQKHHPADAGVQGFSLRARYSEWHRVDEHDQERTDEMSGQDSAVSRPAVLLISFISNPPHSASARLTSLTVMRRNPSHLHKRRETPM